MEVDSSAELVSAEPKFHLVEIEESIFPLDVVLKASYWLSGQYDVVILRDATSGSLQVGFRGSDGLLAPEECLEAERRLRRDLIDFRTRLLIQQETRVVRDLLVAKAFDDENEA